MLLPSAVKWACFRDGKSILLSFTAIVNLTCRDLVRDFVEGVPGNKHVAYRTKDLAMTAFQRALECNQVSLSPSSCSRSTRSSLI